MQSSTAISNQLLGQLISIHIKTYIQAYFFKFTIASSHQQHKRLYRLHELLSNCHTATYKLYMSCITGAESAEIPRTTLWLHVHTQSGLVCMPQKTIGYYCCANLLLQTNNMYSINNGGFIHTLLGVKPCMNSILLVDYHI